MSGNLENEPYFKKLTDSLPVMIWRTDQKGFCVYLNQQWSDFTGQSRETSFNKGWHDAVYPDDMPKIRAAFTNAEAMKEAFEVSYYLKHKSGEYFYVTAQGRPEFDHEGKFEGYLGTITNLNAKRSVELALEESEERHRLAIESAGMGTWEYDPGCDLVFCSDKTMEIFGFDTNPITLKNIMAIIVEKDRNIVMSEIAASLRGTTGNYHVEFSVENKIDNTVRFISSNGKVFYDHSNKPLKLVGTCLDVTGEKKIAKEIQLSEERYRHLFESSPVALCEEDLTRFRDVALQLREKGVQDFYTYFESNPGELLSVIQEIKVGDVNGAVLKLVEADVKNDVINGLDKIFVSDTSRNLIEQLNIVANGGGHFEFETRIRSMKGKDIDVLVNIEFPSHNDYSSILISLIDISQRIGAERKLRESEEGFRTLSNAVPALVFVADTKGDLTYLNDYIHNYGRAKKKEDGTWTIQGIIHPDDYSYTRSLWVDSILVGGEFWGECRIKMKDENYRWHLIRGTPLKDDEGIVLKWFGSATDIHASKEYSATLEKEVKLRTSELFEINAVLKQSNQELEHFAHIVSHDLKEPVRKMHLFTELIFNDTDSVFSDTVLFYRDKVNSAIFRMNSMIKGVLQYSLLGGTEILMESVDLNSLIQSIESDLELNIINGEATLYYHDLPTLNGSEVMLYQVFYNLITNSLKFITDDRKPVIRISSAYVSKNDRPFAVITVEDNGIGFNQQYAEKIFDSFARLNPKDRYEGTGLGLSLCKKIVSRLNGSIEAFAQEGKGAKFVVTLPV